jgi:hypothetical protein
MSFILDALKKSETERQRQSIPGLVDAGNLAPRARLPLWALGLGALLAVNLVVLSIVLTRNVASTPQPPSAVAARPGATTPHATAEVSGAEAPGVATPGVATPGVATPGVATPGVATSGVATTMAATPAAAPGHFSPLDAPTVYAPEIPLRDAASPAAPAPAAQAAAPPPVRLKSAGPKISRPAAAERREPLLTDDYKANDDEVLPTSNEVSLTGAQELPELHLDVHVFATRPADRFVYINMRKYHEGATLQEGPTIERIRRDGVILSYQGLRFLMPRQ